MIICYFILLGYWLFHCHLSFHIEVGMGLIFKVGEHEDFPPIPENFPKCGSWLPPVEDDENDLFHAPKKEKVSVVIQDLPYNVTDMKKNIRTERPSTNNEDEPTESSGDSLMITDLPISLPDEENFVLPQRLTNGTVSHSESQILHTASGLLRNSANAFLMFLVCPISYIFTLYIRWCVTAIFPTIWKTITFLYILLIISQLLLMLWLVFMQVEWPFSYYYVPPYRITKWPIVRHCRCSRRYFVCISRNCE